MTRRQCSHVHWKPSADGGRWCQDCDVIYTPRAAHRSADSHIVTVTTRWSAAELARLDAARLPGEQRAVAVRRLALERVEEKP